MAGDWLKMEKATSRKPEILRIAAALSVHPDHAFGLCFRFWSWCDDHLTTGNASGVTAALVDALLERSGFCDALVSVGWLRVREGSLEVPNFDRHLSESAKKRALTAQRVAKHKDKKSNAAGVSSALPREEKRREELDANASNKPPPLMKSVGDVPIPDALNTLAFISAWKKWQQYRRELRKPLTVTGAETCLKQLSGMGESKAIVAIENSMAKGWQGIFEPDKAVQAKKPGQPGSGLMSLLEGANATQ